MPQEPECGLTSILINGIEEVLKGWMPMKATNDIKVFDLKPCLSGPVPEVL